MRVLRSYLWASVATVTVLAVLSAISPPRMLTFGMLALGPALAMASSSPACVLGVGGYALAAAFAISTWQGLLGTLDQILRLLVMAAVTGISWAITRHRRALLDGAADAARERDLLAAFAAQSSDAIVVSTLGGTITAWNVGAEHLYGYTADEAIGTDVRRLLSPERVRVMDQTMADLAAGRHIRLDEVRRIRRDGSEVLVSVAVSPIRDASGAVVAVAATERDISERKKREDEERLEAERRSRAERMESLGHLAGGVAHDFNNMLAIIVNYTDLLADEVTPDGAPDLARIRDAADRAGSLVDQLLLFAKREPTQVETVDLNDVTQEAGELLRRGIGCGIQLVCQGYPGPIPVRANRGRLDQILLNLVINARDAMPDGGTVAIEADLTEVRAGPRNPVTPGPYARLTVSDTGTGMTPEVRDRLFEPFFTTKPADKGTGLGLSTVYGIVSDAGGHITVESAAGIGTTFVILLPLATDPLVTEPLVRELLG
ncbi:two-component system sensor histidine kinase NtrB [Actinoplanes italicus]|uniref:histidine kinase n=1 Tax=Actinoplanes italicus TaxID=113567 RepID=A0A2T0K872_9ACTN|nr:PAS domain-containing sensor histidine kinase [Actinoplanes italicus]PRX19257.1 PAS/PAC sensor signal transduction histidine kinase [Actinoplanes italicus]